MKHNFAIGTEWKTRGGWRAVIVGIDRETMRLTVWHDSGHKCTEYHSKGGQVINNGFLMPINTHDLIEPWKEPIIHEGWVVIYNNPENQNQPFEDALFFSDKPDLRTELKRMACIKVKFEEGEGL